MKPALERRRKRPIPNVSSTLLEVMKILNKNNSITIKARNKGNRGLHKGLSKRRSLYVGVSKNGIHWQTLINFGKIKKYIGTYSTEKEAALTYDFYAFGVHGLKAKTNFKHAGEQIKNMIQSFIDNDHKFDPSLFTVQY
mmetsp:Transcript_716/g.839  ORF Transcript_716/g.839 Transcript_716/m.839 type:complete len:139 (+) Transcript_716:252-668(+)